MIPLLNKLPKIPDRPPIRYNIKTEYITEELNNTFESYVYRGRPTSGSWNTPSWNGILKTNNQAIENNPIYIKIIRNLVDNSATIIFRVSKKSLIENFKILVNNKEVDISNRKEIGNDYYEYQIFKYNDNAKIDFTRINDLVAYTARLGRWKMMPFGIHLKNMNIQRKTFQKGDASTPNRIEYKYIHEINYKITKSNLSGQSFEEDKYSSISYLKIDGYIYSKIKQNEGNNLLAKLYYSNIMPKENKKLPMNEKLLKGFYLEKYKYDLSGVENDMKNKYDQKIVKNNDFWEVTYSDNQSYSYNKTTKSFIEDKNGKVNGYILPLNFSGYFSRKFIFKNLFDNTSTILHSSDKYSQPFFDKYNGLIKLRFDKKQVDWNTLEKNTSIWTYK